VKSLNKIIVAIVHAVPGVANAFAILAIVMCIYSILAVEFFKEVGVGCLGAKYTREGFGTKRVYCMGHEYFGTFSKSMYTFFQVLTGESWSENVARPVIWYFQDPIKQLGSGLFFVSFVLVTSFVLTNVVVAVLLDKMTANEEAPEPAPAEEEAAPAPVATLTKEEKEIAKKLGSLRGTLGELSSAAPDLQKDLDMAQTDMAELRDQVALLFKAVEKKYRVASL